MKRWKLIVGVLVLGSLLSACGRKPAGAIIVYPDRLLVVGHAKIYFSGIPGLSDEPMDPWRPGNAAIFRVDRTVEGREGRSFSGKAGKVYWINERFELEEMGQADLAKTDEDIARQFGVEVKSQSASP
jgi:hypothetical protein